jgi:hypothetical protein
VKKFVKDKTEEDDGDGRDGVRVQAGGSGLDKVERQYGLFRQDKEDRPAAEKVHGGVRR